MAEGIIVYLSHWLESQPAIKVRRLKAVRRQHDLSGSPRAGFVLDRLHEGGANTPSTPLRVDPERLHLTNAAPCPAVNAGDNFVAGVTKEDREESNIRDPGVRQIVLVDTVFQELDVPTIGRIENS